MPDLKDRVEQFRLFMAEQRAALQGAEKMLEQREASLAATTRSEEVWARATVVIRDVTTAIQERLRVQVAEIVTLALDVIFDGRYVFDLKFEVKYGRVHTLFRLTDKAKRKSFDPVTENGGGIVDVVSFALRLAFWAISANRSNPLFVMDEPFKFVSEDLRVKVGTFLQQVSARLGLQLVLVTHQKFIEDCADRVFVVGKGVQRSVVTMKKRRRGERVDMKGV